MYDDGNMLQYCNCDTPMSSSKTTVPVADNHGIGMFIVCMTLEICFLT